MASRRTITSSRGRSRCSTAAGRPARGRRSPQAWRTPASTLGAWSGTCPARFFLRIEARDTAGNLAAFQTREPSSSRLARANGRLRSAEPLDPTAVGNSAGIPVRAPLRHDILAAMAKSRSAKSGVAERARSTSPNEAKYPTASGMRGVRRRGVSQTRSSCALCVGKCLGGDEEFSLTTFAGREVPISRRARRAGHGHAVRQRPAAGRCRGGRPVRDANIAPSWRITSPGRAAACWCSK